MKIITMKDLRQFDSHYYYVDYLPDDWSGTALDILRMENIPAKDRLWCVLREGLIDDRTLRLFAVWCARQALAMIESPDPRSVAACEVAERYANNEASEKELREAEDNTWNINPVDGSESARYAASRYATYWKAYHAARWAANAAAKAADYLSPSQEYQVQHLIHMIETSNL